MNPVDKVLLSLLNSAAEVFGFSWFVTGDFQEKVMKQQISDSYRRSPQDFYQFLFLQ